MKIAVASSGQELGSNVDEHTGRASFFIVYDTEVESFEAIDNWLCFEHRHWAGVRSMNALLDAGVKAIIVRNIGPNAFRKLTDAQIHIYFTREDSVARAIRRFRDGALREALEPNCTGHTHLSG